jgi:hypothetical protein
VDVVEAIMGESLFPEVRNTRSRISARLRKLGLEVFKAKKTT